MSFVAVAAMIAAPVASQAQAPALQIPVIISLTGGASSSARAISNRCSCLKRA